MANHILLHTHTYTHPGIRRTHSQYNENERMNTHRPNYTSSKHFPFLTVFLNFKIILHFEKK